MLPKDLLQKYGRAGGTVQSVLCYSDETHLTFIRGGKNIYLMNITLSNIHSDVCHKPSKISIVPLVLLSVITKLTDARTTVNEICCIFHTN